MEDNQVCQLSRWYSLKQQLNNLSPKATDELLQTQDDLVIIDVRRPDEFEQGHFPKAINLNYLAPEFWDEVEQLDKDKTYLIYCRSGRRSIRACTLMKNGGFNPQKIFNLDGGILAYDEAPTLSIPKS